MPTSATSSKFPVYLLLGIIIATPACHARITRIEIERIESPTFGGASFGKTGGWLARCTKQRACPKIIHLDSGTEAWGARNSLVVADAHGKRDLPVPENVRFYYFSSTQHNPDAKPRYGNCKNLSNPNPRIETIRALLVAMQAWIAEGTLPPPSLFPRVSDGTLVTAMTLAASAR